MTHYLMLPRLVVRLQQHRRATTHGHFFAICCTPVLDQPHRDFSAAFLPEQVPEAQRVSLSRWRQLKRQCRPTAGSSGKLPRCDVPSSISFRVLRVPLVCWTCFVAFPSSTCSVDTPSTTYISNFAEEAPSAPPHPHPVCEALSSSPSSGILLRTSPFGRRVSGMHGP